MGVMCTTLTNLAINPQRVLFSFRELQLTPSNWHLDYVLPEMPPDICKLLKGDGRALLDRKWRSKIVQVLYEDVVQLTL